MPSTREENNSSTSRRGQNRWKQNSAIQKGEVIHDYETGVKEDVILAKYKINWSSVSKLYRERQKMLKCAAFEYRKHLTLRLVTKYLDLYRILEFQEA